MLNGDELLTDCGGSCASCVELFDTDADTLAIFELNGDVSDSSGNDRGAVLLGGEYVDTAWGQGLSLSGQVQVQGLDWSMYSNLLVHPYTIEMVLTPDTTSCFRRIFNYDDSSDFGWYYCNGIQAYPASSSGEELPSGVRHYLAFVSTAPDQVDVYYNGDFLFATASGFSGPPANVILFKDDGLENVAAVVDGVRISSVSRSSMEIADQFARINLLP